MLRKMLLPLFALSASFVLSSCGSKSSSDPIGNNPPKMGATANVGGESTNPTGATENLDPKLTEITKVEDSKTVPVENTEQIRSETSPIGQIGVYVVGFHPMRDEPNTQMTAHHFCSQKTNDFIQCVLFDGNTENANLIGIEYIISKNAFELLPAEEKKLWHPHNFEVLSGQLIAPGMNQEQEKQLMNTLMNSYGKTWHAWNSLPIGQEPHAFPTGEAKLAWSFTKEGQAKVELITNRDQAMKVNTQEARERRQDLVQLAEPQCGVDLLEGSFEGTTESIEGVEAKDQSQCYPDMSQVTPTQPSQPAKPQPTEPEQPAQPAEPEQPAQPTEPEQPAQPTEPEQPAQPTEPEQPAQPAEPEQPAQPAEPEQPAKPTQPSQPAKPQPTEPEQPTQPTEPEQPIQQGSTSEPEQPTETQPGQGSAEASGENNQKGHAEEAKYRPTGSEDHSSSVNQQEASDTRQPGQGD